MIWLAENLKKLIQQAKKPTWEAEKVIREAEKLLGRNGTAMITGLLRLFTVSSILEN